MHVKTKELALVEGWVPVAFPLDLPMTVKSSVNSHCLEYWLTKSTNTLVKTTVFPFIGSVKMTTHISGGSLGQTMVQDALDDLLAAVTAGFMITGPDGQKHPIRTGVFEQYIRYPGKWFDGSIYI